MKCVVRQIVGWLVIVVVITVFITSCANMASPNGGPYDELPPQYIRSTPRLNQTNFTGKRIEIIFDELIQIDRPSENVIVTPPQKNSPDIRTIGKKVTVELKDSLILDITYTIDFTNSISDYNEKNPLENFSLAFSTGDVIDSLEVSGIVLDASNLEPMPGIMVGLHQDPADSAFTKTPFFRTSKTNDRGMFTIRNVAEGTYRLYALNDLNRDYLFNQPDEDIAFLDSIIVPRFEAAIRHDTIWKDSLTVDTVRMVEYNRFIPDDIVLHLFKEKFQRQYMIRHERTQNNLFTLRFNAPLETLPVLELLEHQAPDNWYITQIPDDETTVNYWITDSLVWKLDTLHLSITHYRTDSLMNLQLQTDTVPLSMRRQQAPPQRRSNNNEPPPIDFLTMNVSAFGSFNVFDTLSVNFSEPVLISTKDVFQLELKQDTLWSPVEFTLRQDSINALRYYIERRWNYDEEFRLIIDSAKIFSVYGKWNNTLETTFSLKSENEYGHFFLNISGISEPAFVELLDGNDVPVRKAKLEDGGALFMDLRPDKYYVRLIVDTNENGIWDTGNYADKLQPEEVYYSSQFYEIPANFGIERDWDVFSIPVSKQKPMDITKNKPNEITRQRRDYRQEGQTQQNRSSGMGGMDNLGRGFGF